MRLSTFCALVAIIIACPAAAQSAPPDTEGGRYVLRRVDDGLMRVDRQTGATSLCRKRGSGWACEAVADDREALEEEIARLSRENAELAMEIGRLREQLAKVQAPRDLPGQAQPGAGGGAAPGDDGASGERTLRLPTDEEIDEVARTFESMMRRFMDSMKALRERYENERL
ncbi:hypothetical protein EDC22_10720 [Tepidamorphus gemmatus]|uniref:Uncharacterized protein n=1 Tax=Tepidamorphus gemmatus TaxID=747076 RepID=A0A4R3M6W3_9HYPH|nr:hypothetical protein [Tepidamorphus gemmatus]TCT09174.1 hypothetical protein EDC22_10720 [Tepidamorphus gemmatus]